ncbi:hypothetical protein BCON_0431g00040 [Botryotinia convoluta]|uniref:Uncharacterized protein n=1 Tax=Botryotinia convoluta TaxID=54673 RepID=A0A4Z1H7I0_9HELO|nr:hypothetical protein BCON_0431g00040 [Botryotinia convoluta]
MEGSRLDCMDSQNASHRPSEKNNEYDKINCDLNSRPEIPSDAATSIPLLTPEMSVIRMFDLLKLDDLPLSEILGSPAYRILLEEIRRPRGVREAKVVQVKEQGYREG